MVGVARVERSWRILVLEDEVAFRRRIVATLELHTSSTASRSIGDDGPSRKMEIDGVDTLAAAERKVFREAYDAWILDIWLPDGSSLDLLEHARREGFRTPALMLTGDVDARLANRAQLLGAEMAYKPDVMANVLVFVDRVIGVRAPRTAPRIGGLENAATEAGLSPRELDILRASRRGLSRAQVAETLGLSENTVKTMMRRLLVKGEARSASELIDRWRTPLQGLPQLELDTPLPASDEDDA
jgi:two-component system vancomycin resistance associated response regulator VraR